MLAFLHLVQETYPFIRFNMSEYQTELFQNVRDFGWPAAKGDHLVVMTKMEGVGLVTWTELKKVNKIRKTYVRATGGHSKGSYNNHTGNSKTEPKKSSSIPCKEYQEGKCNKQNDHDIGLIIYTPYILCTITQSIFAESEQKRSDPTSTMVATTVSLSRVVDTVRQSVTPNIVKSELISELCFRHLAIRHLET